MATERFTKEEFEAALPKGDADNPLWECLGLEAGEYVYIVPVNNTNKRIVIRSSIASDGVAASTGKNSIRHWIEYRYKGEWYALGKHDTKWTARTKNWRTNLVEKLRDLYQVALDDSRKPVKTSAAEEKERILQVANAAKVIVGADHKEDGLVDIMRTAYIKSSSSMAKVLADETGKEPNPEQLEAITASIDCAQRVLAPPGSGKTFLLERRNAYLIGQGISPDHILNVTFNKNMADVGKERTVRTIRREYPDLDLTEFEGWCCTIHALCYRMLKRDGDTRDVPKTWQMKKAVQEVAESLWPFVSERPGWKEIYHWICQPKFRGLSTSEDLDFYIDVLGALHGPRLHEARRLFDNKMRRDGFITFPDMLYDVEVKLTRDQAFREKWQAKFQVVNIDEAQDTNGQAMHILATLAAPQNSVTAVGDVDQLLYRFNGATPESNLYDGFERRYLDGVMVKLSVNYRSTRAIIEACSKLIAHNYGEGRPYDAKYMKEVQPRQDAPNGDEITFQTYDTADAEAQELAKAIFEQLASGRELGDIFVGARTRAQLGYLEGPLVRAKIPFINAAGGSFWASKHVADVVAYLRLVVDDRDKAAFKQVFNAASNWNTHPWGDRKGEYCSHRYLGKAFLSACGGSYTNIWSAATKKSSFKPGVNDMSSFMRELKVALQGGGHLEAIDFILENCYTKYLQAEEGLGGGDESENGKLEDLKTVRDVASQFPTAAEFLAHVDELIKASEAARDRDWSDYVIVSTVHRLKGQERKVVFGVGLAQGLLPHRFAFEKPPQFGILPTGGMARLEDERDIAFVLVSRAMEEVHLSAPERYRGQAMFVSQFIGELGVECADDGNAEECLDLAQELV